MQKKKVIAVAVLTVLLLCYAVKNVYDSSFSAEVAEAAAEQQKYSMTVMRTRANIYDRNLLSLTDSGCFRAVVIPSITNVSYIKKYALESPDYDKLLREGMPFTVKVNGMLKHDGIYCFADNDRNAAGISASVLGYIGCDGHGAAGAELAFDDVLSEKGGEIKFTYTADALGRAIAGEEAALSGSIVNSRAGIALSIDSDIQKKVQKAAEKIEKGAVIVSEINSGEILASLSLPDYEPENIENYLDSEDSPLIDRTLEAFTPGSVFKLCTAAAGLKNGISPRDNYLCTGSCDVGGLFFSCYGSKAHGFVNMHTAIQKSCNCFFIDITKRLEYGELYKTACSLGLGNETDTGMLVGKGGNIPKSVSSEREYANTAIGQGDLSVTPVQMNGMISAIARGGKYIRPTLYKGEVNEKGELSENDKSSACISVMEELVALRIKSYMESAQKYGTASGLEIEAPRCGIKTGTAQTGVFDGEKERMNYWYCGYIGDEKEDKYVIIVLDEGNSTGNNKAAEVFADIANMLFRDHLIESK